MMPRLRFTVSFALLTLSACSATEATAPDVDPPSTVETPALPNFRTVAVALRPMELRERRYEGRLYATDTRVRSLNSLNAYPTDDEGVILVRHNSEFYYNPVSVGQFGIMWANGHRNAVETNKLQEVSDEYLRLARAHADRLWEVRVVDEWQGSELTYFPYEFGFKLHGIDTEVMEPTWYSGMAQGLALTLFSWLYELTGEEEFRARAHSVFLTMYRVDEGGNLIGGKALAPRTSFIDANDYIWFDEYPHEMRTMVLNGFIYATFGVHDYWQITQDPNAARLLAGASATLRHYAHQYVATDGGPSYYCLKHRAQSAGYHQAHVNLLRGMFLVTGDYIFESLAQEFEESYIPPSE